MTEATEVSKDIETLQKKIDDIQQRAEYRNKIFSSARMNQLIVDGYDSEAALEALLLVASAVLCEEVPEENLRLALYELATRIETLDDWITNGGNLPPQWSG